MTEQILSTETVGLPESAIDVLVFEVGEEFFGIEASVVRMITEFSAFDENIIIEPHIGSIKLSDTKIPLLNIAEFLQLPSTDRDGKLSAVIVSLEDGEFFSIIVARILKTISAEYFYKLPIEAMRYPDIYKSAFEFKGKFHLLLDLKGVLSRLIEHVKLQGEL